MKVQIIGNGSFGSFLRELLPPHFEVIEDSQNVILAVPISAYEELGRNFANRHLINVCSVQSVSTEALLKYTDRVTSIHPLFGRRTPAEHRSSILTHRSRWEESHDFIDAFYLISPVIRYMPPEKHDGWMAQTHKAAVSAALELRKYVDAVGTPGDWSLPHSFRLLQQFVQTLKDMPEGTIESIMANPYSPRFEIPVCIENATRALELLATEYDLRNYPDLAKETRAIAEAQKNRACLLNKREV